MAHALKRISYATCDPDFCQFSFLAREPKANLSMQFCHAFMTSSKEEVREWHLNFSIKKKIIGGRVKIVGYVNEATHSHLVE